MHRKPSLFVHICVASLLVGFAIRPTQGSCQGQGCVERDAWPANGHPHRPLQASCTPQQYPKQGALLPVTLESRVLDVLWPAADDQTAEKEAPQIAFALVADVDGFPGGPLWRSDKNGKADSWKDVTPALKAAFPANETSSHAGVVNIVWHGSKPSRLLFQGRSRYHWTSSDGGATFQAVKTPGNELGYAQEIKPHPRQADWLMAKVRRGSCLADPRGGACGIDLFISKDWGSSWMNLTEASNGKVSSVRDFEWAAKLPQYAGKPTPDEAVFATIYTGDAHKGLYPGWDKDLHYVVTLDLFKSAFAKVIPCGNLFETIAGKVFLAVPSECPVGPDGKARKSGSGTVTSRSVTLYVSRTDGDGFLEACLPAALEDDGYNLVHTHDGSAAFVLADHAEPGSWGPTSDSPTSDAYAPAYNASLHTMSLPDVYRRDFITDFNRVEGLVGMYIANQVDPAGRLPGSRGREASFLRTRLTLNGGASWQAIPVPKAFRFGHCNTCAPGSSPEQCSLHLHGPTSWFAPEGPHPNFYSQPTAPGLVLATGNVGPHLDMSPDADCTWMSRDGGQTWEDIADNTAIYEMGNHGGVVVLAQHRSEGPTDVVTFSMDGGACFHKVQLPEPILVENIRVAPGGNSGVFVVHGTACVRTSLHPACSFTGGATPPGKIFAVDLPELLGAEWRECSTADGSPDYEVWHPPSEGKCLLGAARPMKRRTSGTSCVNPPGWRSDSGPYEPCKCSVDDVECEFGYEKNANGTCVPIRGLQLQEACPRLANGDYLTSSSHLRLVHGDVCTGINDLIPDTNGRGGRKGSDSGGDGEGGCGSKSWGGAIRSFFVLLFTCGAVAVAGGLTWMHCLSDAQREAAKERAMPLLAVLAAGFETALGMAVDVYDWVRARVRTLPFMNQSRFEGSWYEGRGGYEPLGGSGGLDLDPEDHRSPPLVAQGGLP